MKKIKVSEATNVQLDWLVAKCEGIDLFETEGWLYDTDEGTRRVYRPTTDWSQMGPIIGRGSILFHSSGDGATLEAYLSSKGTSGPMGAGEDHLIAAARCYVTSKLGDTAEVPEELK